MEQVVPEKWHCIECHRNVICKADTLAVLGWRFFALGPKCPECQEKEKTDRRKYFKDSSHTRVTLSSFDQDQLALKNNFKPEILFMILPYTDSP